jgi:hypothetical protein
LAFIAATTFIAGAAVATVGQAMLTVPATRGSDLTAAADFAYSFGWIAYGFAIALTAAQMLAFAALTLRSGFLPKWMGWLALFSGLLAVGGTISAGSEEAVFGGFAFFGYLTWLLWILLASVLLYRRKMA